MVIAAAGGGGTTSGMYAVQIESLEVFQKKLTGILADLDNQNAKLTTAHSASDFSPADFGSFPEAAEFSSSYATTRSRLIESFQEVSQLVNTMISVVGKNASAYQETEADIVTKFNSVLSRYGDSPVPVNTTAASSTASTSAAPTNGAPSVSPQPTSTTKSPSGTNPQGVPNGPSPTDNTAGL